VTYSTVVGVVIYSMVVVEEEKSLWVVVGVGVMSYSVVVVEVGVVTFVAYWEVVGVVICVA